MLTNYSYLQRFPGEFEVQQDDNRALTLIEIPPDDNMMDLDEDMKKSQSQKSFKTVLGFVPVPLGLVDHNLDCINRWINQNILVSNSTMQNYPQDVIKNNGSQIFELIQTITSKQLAFKAKIDPNIKRTQRVLTSFRSSSSTSSTKTSSSS